ncbi:DUF1987 domain-containing protein [Crocinitomix catalasitica]|uniref:DUF1987 domain-containing protein n=1 Tax=Crocinitomix catalasitica TaxID=184607 RepID=UPI00146F95BD|nr:DUF1987 domain-containing protein [Crocinitomix catalasitica]
METLRIIETANTPSVLLSAELGKIEFIGVLNPDEVDEFFHPIFKWVEDYMVNPADETKIKMHIEHFNIAASKRILFLLYKMNDLFQNGANVKISWIYNENDEKMFEHGQDFDHMIEIPMEYLSLKKNEVLV